MFAKLMGSTDMWSDPKVEADQCSRGMEAFVPTTSLTLWPQTEHGTVMDTLGPSDIPRPCVHLHADQCTVGSQAVFFLLPRIRSTGQPDCFHRLWNDVTAGFKLGGQWGLPTRNLLVAHALAVAFETIGGGRVGCLRRGGGSLEC